MSYTQEIKRYVLGECEMDLVGIADTAYLSDEAPGYRPTDILPGAKSVVVFGKRMPDGSVQTAFRAFEDGNFLAKTSYGIYGKDVAAGFTLFFRTFDICQYIERLFGYTATPLPCGPMQCGVPVSVPVPSFVEPFRAGLPLNIERAAYASGLGDYGWSGRILTSEYGPRIQFGAVLTTMPLSFDAPYGGARLCGGADCLACVKHCPVDAIPRPGDETPRSLGVADRIRDAANVKLNRCTVAACALRKEFGGFDDYVENLDPSEEELEAAFLKKPVNHWEGLDHYPKWRCDKCLIYCPTGNWKVKFADRELTRAHGV
jgi:epoxyqueuosine reductase QueG